MSAPREKTVALRTERIKRARGKTPATPEAGFPATRLRRNRRSDWSRRLVRETTLSADDLIWPIFVIEGKNERSQVASMPGVERLSIDLAVKAAETAAGLKLPAVALFPYTDPSLRDEQASEALNPNNLVCRAVRAIKTSVGDIGVICDVALDPYTSHGHDGLLVDGEVDNDRTVEVLVRQALNQAEAGCDILAPSDMMDGRIGAIRRRWRRTASPTRSSSPMPRNMPRRSTGRSATRWALARCSAATSGPIRWIRPTPRRRCARSAGTSPRAPTW